MTPSSSLSRPLQLATVALLALSLGGCIILPVGHRHHHGKGRHVSEAAVIVVPAERGRDHEHRRGRRY